MKKQNTNIRESEEQSLEEDLMIFPDELNQTLFDGDQLKSEVRDKLIEIGYSFKETFDLDFDLIDMYFEGSMAQYNWVDLKNINGVEGLDYKSDIDLHLVVDFNKLGLPLDVLTDYFIAKKQVFNEFHNITVKGFEVELGCEDFNTPSASEGVYSLFRDEWVKKPSPVSAEVENIRDTPDYNEFRNYVIDTVKSEDYNKAKDLWEKIKYMRRTSLALDGEFGKGNLIFKALRQEKLLDLLWTFVHNEQDKQLSLLESKSYDKSTYDKRYKEITDPDNVRDISEEEKANLSDCEYTDYLCDLDDVRAREEQILCIKTTSDIVGIGLNGIEIDYHGDDDIGTCAYILFEDNEWFVEILEKSYGGFDGVGFSLQDMLDIFGIPMTAIKEYITLLNNNRHIVYNTKEDVLEESLTNFQIEKRYDEIVNPEHLDEEEVYRRYEEYESYTEGEIEDCQYSEEDINELFYELENNVPVRKEQMELIRNGEQSVDYASWNKPVVFVRFIKNESDSNIKVGTRATFIFNRDGKFNISINATLGGFDGDFSVNDLIYVFGIKKELLSKVIQANPIVPSENNEILEESAFVFDENKKKLKELMTDICFSDDLIIPETKVFEDTEEDKKLLKIVINKLKTKFRPAIVDYIINKYFNSKRLYNLCRDCIEIDFIAKHNSEEIMANSIYLNYEDFYAARVSKSLYGENFYVWNAAESYYDNKNYDANVGELVEVFNVNPKILSDYIKSVKNRKRKDEYGNEIPEEDNIIEESLSGSDFNKVENISQKIINKLKSSEISKEKVLEELTNYFNTDIINFVKNGKYEYNSSEEIPDSITELCSLCLAIENISNHNRQLFDPQYDTKIHLWLENGSIPLVRIQYYNDTNDFLIVISDVSRYFINQFYPTFEEAVHVFKIDPKLLSSCLKSAKDRYQISEDEDEIIEESICSLSYKRGEVVAGKICKKLGDILRKNIDWIDESSKSNDFLYSVNFSDYNNGEEIKEKVFNELTKYFNSNIVQFVKDKKYEYYENKSKQDTILFLCKCCADIEYIAKHDYEEVYKKSNGNIRIILDYNKPQENMVGCLEINDSDDVFGKMTLFSNEREYPHTLIFFYPEISEAINVFNINIKNIQSCLNNQYKRNIKSSYNTKEVIEESVQIDNENITTKLLKRLNAKSTNIEMTDEVFDIVYEELEGIIDRNILDYVKNYLLNEQHLIVNGVKPHLWMFLDEVFPIQNIANHTEERYNDYATIFILDEKNDDNDWALTYNYSNHLEFIHIGNNNQAPIVPANVNDLVTIFKLNAKNVSKLINYKKVHDADRTRDIEVIEESVVKDKIYNKFQDIDKEIILSDVNHWTQFNKEQHSDLIEKLRKEYNVDNNILDFIIENATNGDTLFDILTQIYAFELMASHNKEVVQNFGNPSIELYIDKDFVGRIDSTEYNSQIVFGLALGLSSMMKYTIENNKLSLNFLINVLHISKENLSKIINLNIQKHTDSNEVIEESLDHSNYIDIASEIMNKLNYNITKIQDVVQKDTDLYNKIVEELKNYFDTNIINYTLKYLDHILTLDQCNILSIVKVCYIVKELSNHNREEFVKYNDNGWVEIQLFKDDMFLGKVSNYWDNSKSFNIRTELDDGRGMTLVGINANDMINIFNIKPELLSRFIKGSKNDIKNPISDEEIEVIEELDEEFVTMKQRNTSYGKVVNSIVKNPTLKELKELAKEEEDNTFRVVVSEEQNPDFYFGTANEWIHHEITDIINLDSLTFYCYDLSTNTFYFNMSVHDREEALEYYFDFYYYFKGNSYLTSTFGDFNLVLFDKDIVGDTPFDSNIGDEGMYVFSKEELDAYENSERNNLDECCSATSSGDIAATVLPFGGIGSRYKAKKGDWKKSAEQINKEIVDNMV